MKMTEYEAALVLRSLDDERVQASIARYTQVIEQRGGEVEQPNIWGKRRLSFEINGENDGVYVFLLYKAGPDVNAELDRLMRIDENVLRHLLVVRPLPNPPKPVSVPEGGSSHGDGPRSMPSHSSEGSVPMPKPKGMPIPADAPKVEENAAEGAEPSEAATEESHVDPEAGAPAEVQPSAEPESEAEAETPTSENE